MIEIVVGIKSLDSAQYKNVTQHTKSASGCWLVVDKVGKLMEGFIVQADTSLHCACP
jgi:hypothetical protein